MVDMNAEMYRCCGYTVEIYGYIIELADGKEGRRVHCELCESAFDVPGGIDEVKEAIPDHFREMHGLEGALEAWRP